MSDKQRILLVDDDPNISHLVRLYLEKEGFSVITCENGIKAVELHNLEKPDLILLDIHRNIVQYHKHQIHGC